MGYNSNSTGWSYGQNPTTNQSGWFPTSCCNINVVKATYPFDTKPETTRPYISFQAGQHILIETEYDCGWWLGCVITDTAAGSLGPKGYFPGNYVEKVAEESSPAAN